ncbi:hypothetical protein [Calycomorphotria hydatis]|uniref:DUF3859 domain-containing protein n=1 Tax=Calycomorphotria hydatis TaxID=2528027 RepID=A0A517TBD1_9PLAN|nr:hypothetical protein [Calycomorphotria hydatis]QDT65683.1 hypothetical protein V22_29430 [Calycomorphotria hydatis]
MFLRSHFLFQLSAMAVVMTTGVVASAGDCPNCRRGGSMSAQMLPTPDPSFHHRSVVPSRSYLPPSPSTHVVSTPLVAPIAPPAGTLGVTYRRPSRPIPADRHPRVAIFELAVPAEFVPDPARGVRTRVTLDDPTGQLEPIAEKNYYYDERAGLWVFETDPLIPGRPHVWRVTVEKVYYENQDIRRYGRLVTEEVETDVEFVGARYMRLIPGRVVTMDW